MSLPRTPSFRLDGKRALVTGGTRGIGLGAAVALAEAGAAVTITARTAADVEAVMAQMRAAGLAVEGAALDVTDTPAFRTFVAAAAPFVGQPVRERRAPDLGAKLVQLERRFRHVKRAAGCEISGH